MNRRPETASRRSLRGAVRPPLRHAPVGLWLAVVALAAVFLLHDTDRFSAPFGPSHDGFNAALYMTGGRALVEEGPTASRLGARSTVHGEEVLYAHHPPFVYLADALARVVPASDETRARLPAIVASLTELILLAALLRALDLHPIAGAVGLMVAFATPFFAVFGAVTEPHILGLLPVTAFSLVWIRSRRRGEQPSAPVLASIAVLACLTSWEAALFVGLAGGALAIERILRAAFA